MSILAAFILGLAGSLHCAAMCGPLVLALSGVRRGASWPWLYHAGRILVYLVLGAISGAAGFLFGFERWLSIGAGLIVIILALVLYRGGGITFGGRLTIWMKGWFARFVPKESPASTMFLGACNGLLPCGLVYLACASAAASAGILGGMGAMLAFGVGTLPMLVAVHFTGRTLCWKGLNSRRTILVFAGLAGTLLVVRGLALGIPYLSPSLLPGQSCCH